jgi:hypothetical protein
MLVRVHRIRWFVALLLLVSGTTGRAHASSDLPRLHEEAFFRPHERADDALKGVRVTEVLADLPRHAGGDSSRSISI